MSNEPMPSTSIPATATPGQVPANSPAGVVALPPTITIDDFVKVEFRVATVLEAAPAPKGDKLLVLKVDLGTEQRTILAGIRQHYSPEQMVGKQIIVVANLAPRKMMGLESQGMLLAAHDPATGKVIVLSPSEAVSAGSKVS
ncbi:methionine--tRNA ligase subunit beta [Humisphaera borealis]|uniref:Methionine--tRNA ligase n=1 Tax=Humisphaera borealis TaxID=2807512 RepID=A0A7M2WYU9_9BACT|nr:methionine--tRNA ligase subunit beta [Humisphaera borealis]QOV90392.1 methionine--tRNA ligase subunit beta [Humisphaera borealis]